MKEQTAANDGKKFPFRGNDVPVAFPKPKPLSRKFLSEGFHQAAGKSLSPISENQFLMAFFRGSA